MNLIKRLFSLLVSTVFLVSLTACAAPLTYSAAGIEAKVVNADTKEPIEGVIVAANWQLEQGTFGGSISAGQLMVMEAVTGKDGKFSFPGFGPRLVVNSQLVNDDPQLFLFKSGYEYRRLNNPYSSAPELRLRPERRSVWNGKTIELKKFQGTVEEYAKHLRFISLGWVYSGNDCEWKKIPHLVTAIHKQEMTFRQQGIVANLYTIESLIPYPGYPDKCGAREYFKESRP